MILRIDQPAVRSARYINIDNSADARTYYLIPTPAGDAIVVCRNGLKLEALANQIVDCALGNDVAQVGFANEAQIGQQRTKITIYRVVTQPQPRQSLSQILNAKS